MSLYWNGLVVSQEKTGQQMAHGGFEYIVTTKSLLMLQCMRHNSVPKKAIYFSVVAKTFQFTRTKGHNVLFDTERSLEMASGNGFAPQQWQVKCNQNPRSMNACSAPIHECLQCTTLYPEVNGLTSYSGHACLYTMQYYQTFSGCTISRSYRDSC